MKIPCPNCSQTLTLPERFAGKITKCPACQKSFEVPGPPPGSPEAAAAVNANIAPAMAKNEEMGLQSLMQEKKPDGPPELNVCPACNAPWKKGATDCPKCQYNVFVGGKLRKPPKQKFNFKIDTQQIFLYLFVAGLLFGGYWLYNNFGDIKRKGDKAFDDAARGHPSEEDDTPAKRKDAPKPDGNN